MSDVMNNILTRRSVRSYKPDMVPKDVIEKVATAGLYAANGMGAQSTIIVAVTDKETRDRLSRANASFGPWKEYMDPFYGAPVVLIVLADKKAMTYIYDGACTMENLMLAAHDAGLGSCWVHRAKEEFETPEWKEWLKGLGVEGDYEGIGHCILGYAAEAEPEAKPRNEGRILFVE